MEEEPGENELEERMYAMLHYADETQKDVDTNKQNVVLDFDNVPKSTVRRYWRTSDNRNTSYNKVNTSAKINSSHQVQNKIDSTDVIQITPKDEKSSPSSNLSMFQEPVSENIKKTVEILDNDEEKVVELESSEEDEVVEVALPPKPTITIESSDEDEIQITSKSLVDSIDRLAETSRLNGTTSKNARGSSSPVPSIVSSTSDDFIRGDCLALNITSHSSNNQSLELSLHASDFEQTPPKKRRKKKNKDATSTPLTVSDTIPNSADVCFATPKSKAKNKTQKKSYQVLNTVIPNADVYDSDSNHSQADSVKNQETYTATDKKLQKTGVSKTDSNNSHHQSKPGYYSDIDSSEHSTAEADSAVEELQNTAKNITQIVDLTDKDIEIDENIVMANVTGLPTIDISKEEESRSLHSKCGSTRIPAILNDDLDFDNFKGNNVSCRRRYSVSKLRAEMDKFYNESWGGEDFNHREILKNMSRDKNLWAIDPKDRMSVLAKRKVTCNYCNRVGHRDDACRMKPPICYMCGSTGHFEPRCPKKICVNCGSPSRVFTNICQNCCKWHMLRCAECGQNGHPASHCPDVWRRYHYTIDLDQQLEESRQTKKHYQLFCSGCSRKGHLVHTCRLSLPFSGLPIFSPYVSLYRPIYNQIPTNNQSSPSQQNKQAKNKSWQQDETVSSALTPKHDNNKRQSKSPCMNEVVAKKKNLGPQEVTEHKNYVINPLQKKNTQKEKTQSFDKNIEATDINKSTNKTVEICVTDKAPDFIEVPSTNHDMKGQMIQHNEVSDTSDVITSARVYVTNGISEKLKTAEGESWLKETSKKNKIEVEKSDSNLYLSIKGTVGNQEAFQTELRDWINNVLDRGGRKNSESGTPNQERTVILCDNIPKNKNKVLRKINTALEALKSDLGDPNALYKELIFLQNKHKQLQKQKVISPKQLSNNRDHINKMLKNLNMVLLGQAGLANGSKHLNELYTLQEKLINLRQKNIPMPLREEIGQHFHFIFTTIPRNDYVELLNKYYNNEQLQQLKRKNKSPKKNTESKIYENNASNEVSKAIKINAKKKLSKDDKIKKTKNKLILFHNRLSHMKTVASSLLKTKTKLEQKLLSGIGRLHENALVGKKTIKKMNKIQKDAETFLTSL